MAPLLAALAAKGLSLISGAVMAKGQQFVEDKLGVKLKPDMTDEDALKLKQLEFDNEEDLRNWTLEMEKVAQTAVTTRWTSDMSSDSWLAKNVRPIVLLYILTAYTIFSLASGFGFVIHAAYVELLAQWGMLVMSAYFVGRTVEKAIDAKGKQK